MDLTTVCIHQPLGYHIPRMHVNFFFIQVKKNGNAALTKLIIKDALLEFFWKKNVKITIKLHI